MTGRTGMLEIVLTQTHVAEDRLKEMDLAELGDYLVLEIRDTGQGIEPEIIDKIFDPFCFGIPDRFIHQQCQGHCLCPKPK